MKKAATNTKMENPTSSSVKILDFLHSKTSSAVVTGNISKCQEFMRKFWEPRKEKCRTVEQDLPCTKLRPKILPTGITYAGTWEGPWMTGYGVYTFTNGVKYEGEFADGMFHGNGDLLYPNGVKMKGLWYKGSIVHRTIVFADNVEYKEEDWLYCQDSDRRFKVEHDEGIQPAGKSYITAEQPTRDVPKGVYDTGDGFIDSKGCVYKGPDLTSILRAVSVKEKKWIMEHYRNNMDEPIGPVPELYGEWPPAKLELDTSPPEAKTLPKPSLPECPSVFDDELYFRGRFSDMGGTSSSISSSSDDWLSFMWD